MHRPVRLLAIHLGLLGFVLATIGAQASAQGAAATVEVTPATAFTQSGATLNARVNPNGTEVSACAFEFGPNTSYGATVPCAPAPGAGASPVAVSAQLSGLDAGAGYHFRVSATSAAGTSKSADAEFTTCAQAQVAASTASGSPAPAPPSPCWVDVLPYPFGGDGNPVDTSRAPCKPVASRGATEDPPACYLTVTSMAFRAWNRGLAATSPEQPNQEQRNQNQKGVWIFNGTSWLPDTTFPGHRECPGTTILWAGKLDYWLIGAWKGESWPDLCRFDGKRGRWETGLKVPAATLARLTPAPTPAAPDPKPKVGAIRAGSCFAWNDCWFFGSYGVMLHWSQPEPGKPPELSDASPPLGELSFAGELTSGAPRQGTGAVGAAVGGTAETFESGPVATQPGVAPAQLYESSGGPFSPLAFSPFTTAQAGDPYRTDLVAVDLDSEGQGWTAGNPAGLRLHEGEGFAPAEPRPPESRPFAAGAPQPSPLQPFSDSSGADGCAGPSATRFTFTPFPAETKTGSEEGAFVWSSIAVVPSAQEALAGGRVRRAPGADAGGNEDAQAGEPAIAQTSCAGASSVTRFRVPDPLNPGQTAPADRTGSVVALAANAENDAWAAATSGRLEKPGGQITEGINERPHVYRFENGLPPAAAEGNDDETRPNEITEDLAPPPPPEPPAPPEPPPPPAIVTQAHVEKLPPAIYAVKVKLHAVKRHGHMYLSLYLTFKVRRPITIGARALRHGHVVSVAKPRHFRVGRGLLILNLDRRRWPTSVGFVA
jgi:hypothetical protein